MTRTEILEAANRIVCGERETQYGTPEDSFTIIAQLWNAYLYGLGLRTGGIEIDRTDVAAMMALLKIARISSGSGKDDNWIDLAGYAACGGELMTG